MSDDTLRTLIYVAVILLAPINVYVTYRLLSLSHKHDGKIAALSERATVAALLCVGSLSGASLALARLTEVDISPTLAVVLNGVSAVLLALPALYWYIKYRTGGFGDTDG